MPVSSSNSYNDAPWHFLNFFPDPHGHGSSRPTFDQSFAPAGPPATPGTGPPAIALLSDELLPPTCTVGSGRTADPRFGASAGAISSVASVPSPSSSPGTTSSSTPRALYRLLGAGPRRGSPFSPEPSSLRNMGGNGRGCCSKVICARRNLSVKVLWMSPIRSTNMLYASCLYSIRGSFWPHDR